MPITPDEALAYIHSFDDPYLAALRDHGKQTWGIETVRALLREMGDPHLSYPTLHIAGTKGKGSTAAFIAQGCMESGLKTGLYVSPHLEDWRERIQINRALIPPQSLARLVEDAQPYLERFPTLSTFEVSTALALWHFAREDCDAGVIEVGLGGRLDATSVVEPLAAVITNISYDHMQLLGSTLAEIAGEKAAIIKPGVPAISAPQADEARAVIEARAASQGSRIIQVGRDVTFRVLSEAWGGIEVEIAQGANRDSFRVGLAGQFQAENAAVAVAALHVARQAGLAITNDGIRQGLERTRWPCRLETVALNPRIVLDSAHNDHSMEAFARAIHTLNGDRPVIIVFGCMADKDVRRLVQATIPISKRLILTRSDHPRAADPEDLRTLALELLTADGGLAADVVQATASVEEGVAAALAQAAPDDTICVVGSLAVAGAARTWLRQRMASKELLTRE